MDFLFILSILAICAAFGLLNYRSNRQKADALVEEIKRFGKL